MFGPVIKLFGLASPSAMGPACLLLAAMSGAFSRIKALEPDDLLFHRIGNVSLRPNFQIAETYNDNIFFSRENDKEEDWISAVSGGAVILWGKPQESSLLAGYEYTHNFFHNRSDKNSSGHGASLTGNISGGRVTLIPNVLFNSSSSPLFGFLRFNPGTGTLQRDELLVETSTLNATLRAKIDVSRKTFTTTEGRYNFRNYGYTTKSGNNPDDLPVSDYDNFRFRQGFGFQIRPKVSLSAHGFLGNLTIDRSSRLRPRPDEERRYFGGGLSAEGDFTDRLTGEVDFSIERGSITGRLANSFPWSPLPAETYLRPIVAMSLKYRIGKDIFPQLDYIRKTLPGNQREGSSPGVSNQFDLSVLKPFGRRKNWLLRASCNMEFIDWKTGTYKGHSAERLNAALTVQYRIQEWLHSSLLYSWQSFSYDGLRRGVVDYGVNTITWTVRAGY